jgi:CDP-paratose 2-epimerase
MQCAIRGTPYTIIGYGGKQVRDNIHADDLVEMFWHYHQHPRPGEVYNAGGGRHSHCSVREAIRECELRTGRRMAVRYVDENRIGDHRWWISDTRKFQAHYPSWSYSYDLPRILDEMHLAMSRRLARPGKAA